MDNIKTLLGMHGDSVQAAASPGPQECVASLSAVARGLLRVTREIMTIVVEALGNWGIGVRRAATCNGQAPGDEVGGYDE